MGVTIGRLANLAGINVETIRFYERRGLVTQPAKPTRGYRQYPEEAIRRLTFIKRSKSLGFTLGEISELLSMSEGAKATCGNIEERAKKKIAEIKDKITRLESMKRALEILSAPCEGEELARSCPLIEALNADAKKLTNMMK